jgi:hypothetical protein
MALVALALVPLDLACSHNTPPPMVPDSPEPLLQGEDEAGAPPQTSSGTAPAPLPVTPAK